MIQPILYSYRRCPYAMRARMALRVANIDVEIREISLRNKPKHLLAVSPKGTVPVLVLPSGQVIDESLDIMQWALAKLDPNGWLTVDIAQAMQLIKQNDTVFKRALDAYKYPERFPVKSQVEHRADGEVFLTLLVSMLAQHLYLFKQSPSIADIAIFPFIRQFAAVDNDWFLNSPYQQLQTWLDGLIGSELFKQIMQKHPTYVDE